MILTLRLSRLGSSNVNLRLLTTYGPGSERGNTVGSWTAVDFGFTVGVGVAFGCKDADEVGCGAVFVSCLIVIAWLHAAENRRNIINKLRLL